MKMTTRTLFLMLLAIAAGFPARSNAQTGSSSGAVFAMTNAADNNEVVAYKRAPDGSLKEGHSYSTGGRGSGGVTDPLGSQGSLALTQDHSRLLAVNAGSSEISLFRVDGPTLSLLGKAPSGGAEPVAVAQHGALVYVVNAGGTSNVVGFTLDAKRGLTQIPGSTAYLSTGSSGAASLAFSPDGQFLLVTEKVTNVIDAFPVQADGTLASIVVNPSAGPGAFSVVFAPSGAALVAETGPAGGTNASAISSYSLSASGTLSAISASVPTLGAANCWLEVTPDGRFVYTSNSGTSTISGFSIGATGSLTALSGTVVGTLPSGSTNLDIAISADGKYLYTLDSGTGTINTFGISSDGSLTNLGDAGGLSAGAGLNGIAAI